MTSILAFPLHPPIVRTNQIPPVVGSSSRSSLESSPPMSDPGADMLVLSKAYYDLREKLRESEERRLLVEAENEQLRQDKVQVELMLRTQKEMFETEKAQNFQLHIPSVDELETVKRQVQELQSLNRKKTQSVARWRKKFEIAERTHREMRTNYSTLQEKIQTLEEALSSMRTELDSTIRLHEQSDRRKRTEKAKLSTRVFKLNRLLETKTTQLETLETANSTLQRKLQHYEDWTNHLQDTRTKTNRRLVKMREENYSLANELKVEYGVGRERESLIEVMRHNKVLLRQQLRMQRESKQHQRRRHSISSSSSSSVTTGLEQETQFFQHVKSQVDQIASELDLPFRTGDIRSSSSSIAPPSSSSSSSSYSQHQHQHQRQNRSNYFLN